MSKMKPSLRSLDRVRALSVFAFLDSMIVTMVDDLFLGYDHMLHALDKGPADASAASGIDETVLRTCVEGIFPVHELRMKHDITLLRR